MTVLGGEGLSYERGTPAVNAPVLNVPGWTRWSTTLDPKVNLPRSINFWALCGANLATQHLEIKRIEMRVVCGRAPLVLAPHTIKGMGVELCTEENRGSATCGPFISLLWT